VIRWANHDLGEGWLLFALPPAELEVHPGSGDFVQMHAELRMLGAVLYLMCGDLPSFMQSLERKGVAYTPSIQAEWGMSTTLRLPSGGEIRVYQPSQCTMV